VQALIDFLSQHPALALAVLFCAALLESMAVIGTVVPGSTVVVGAGILIGMQMLDPWWAAAAAIVGATLGDGVSFWLGRRYHDRIGAWWPLSRHPELLQRGHAYFAAHGGQSVFLGRFLGPVRAIVPVIAGMSGMPQLRFTVVNVLSAIVWSALLLLPGALFGASLKLAGAVSSRLLILLAILAATGWLGTVLLRLVYQRGWPVVCRQRDRLVAWARPGAGLPQRIVLSLLDPARPESFGILVAALALLGGAWMFLGITEDVVSSDPLVRIDQLLYTALQTLRTDMADTLMIAATELGSATVAIAVITGIAAVLAWKRCWRTLAYWLTAVGFAQALVWILKITLERTRPNAMYNGADQYSFPSGHAASSIVLYGFLAFLLAHGQKRGARVTITLLAAGLAGLIAFSRLYLGAHWLSDVLASLSLGTAWVALLSMAYLQHAGAERLPARAMMVTALGTLIAAGTVTMVTRHAADTALYAPRPTAAAVPVLLADWPASGWQRLPGRRTEVGGDHEEPLSVQWAGAAGQIAQQLHDGGWHKPPPWTPRTALLWLLPATTAEQLPVLAKLHQGESPAMSFTRDVDPAHRLVIRLWQTPWAVAAAAGQPVALWVGMVTLERLEHPAGMVTLAMTGPDYARPLAQLAQSLKAQGRHVETRHRDGVDVLLAQ
jgi:membrane protein DedA with SNARE-associated domain/membrane-associated phospholipid phosphatase